MNRDNRDENENLKKTQQQRYILTAMTVIPKMTKQMVRNLNSQCQPMMRKKVTYSFMKLLFW